MFTRPYETILCLLLGIAISPTGLTQAFQIQFVDNDNQPVQFAVVADTRFPAVATRSSASENQSSAVIDQINMQFSPMVIAINKGEKVSFPNSDNIRHHVYSFSKAKRFETKLYANKPEAPVLFDEPGIVVLGCNIHDSMIGYIFVSAWQSFGTSNDKGRVTLNSHKPPETLEYWHPWSLTPNQVNRYDVKQWPTDGPLVIQLMLNRPETEPVMKTFRRGFGSP